MNLEVIRPCLPSKLILDLDSTVETVYGNQAQAAKGVNAHKPGRKSYHPLLAFEGQSRLCLNAVLRAGNVHSSTEAAPFLKETFDLLGQHPVQYARFDKGFGGEDFYSLWKGRQIGYVGKMKWTKRLAAEVAACRYWKRYVDEDWIIEGIALWYQATSWKKPRRVAVIRKAKSFRTTKLVSCCLPIGSMKRSSRAWSGNPSICGAFTTSGVVWKTTSRKPSADLPSIKFATGSFEANEIDLLVKLLAYNLYERFKQDCCEPVHRGYTIARFRLEFFRNLRAGKPFWNIPPVNTP